jgi:5-formyltetrahydrofolate cyclo-ligase
MNEVYTRQALRLRHKALRLAMDPQAAQKANERIGEHLLRYVHGLEGINHIGIYLAVNKEVNLKIFYTYTDKKLALPKISPDKQMVFAEWCVSDPLRVGRFKMPEPVSDQVVIPDLLIVPLLAVDAQGYRLGYGGGYYDRYLAKYQNIYTIGVGYAWQYVPSIWPLSTDIPCKAWCDEDGVRAF